MAFVLLLMLSVVALTTVETRVAGQAMLRLEAEQNALLALNLALGELQKATGPDQRVTARADLQYATTATNPYWTGAYGHALTPDYDLSPEQIADELTDTNKVDAQGSPAQLLNWLISGNQSADTWPTFADTGEITAPTAAGGRFLPDAQVANVTDSTLASSSSVTIQDSDGQAQPARILVGSGSVESASDFVVAPVVEVENSGSMETDSFAWWVGDENVKARGNLELETDSDELPHAFVNATRAAIELMAEGGSDGALDAARIGNAYDPTAALNRAYMLNDLALTSPTPATLSPLVKRRYHDISMFSESLLIDTFAGGLKRDLSALLDSSYTPLSGDPTFNSNSLWTLHSGDSTGYAVPSWGHLRSFAQTRVPASGAVAPILPVHDRDGEPDHVGVAPVLTYFSLGTSASLAAAPAAGTEINLNLYPLVVLWNPYNFTIQAPAKVNGNGNYEVGMYFGRTPSITVDVNAPGVLPTGESYDWKSIGRLNFEEDFETGNTTKFLRFQLDCPDIPPGQSLVFCLSSSNSGQSYDPTVTLQNLEPDDSSFVSVSMGSLSSDDLTAPQFRLGPLLYPAGSITATKGVAFQDGQIGRLYTYLGVPSSDPVLFVDKDASNSVEIHDPTQPGREWYQTHQFLRYDEIVASNSLPVSKLLNVSGVVVDEALVKGIDPTVGLSVLQGQQSLTYDPSPRPTFTFATQALFSGAGSNAQYNGNQFMFLNRWVAQGNLRALRTSKTRRDIELHPNLVATAGSTVEPGGVDWQRFASGGPGSSVNERASAGSGHDWVAGEPVDATLYEFLSEDEPLISIGQLQHANLSLVGAYPGYPIGNSLADFRLHEKSGPTYPDAPAGYQLARIDDVYSGSGLKGLAGKQIGYYDISYLLNRSLWDRYFLSTVPATGAVPDALPNPRMVYSDTDNLGDPDLAALDLLVAGGFNINSTSEQAWRAVLGGINQLAYDPENPSSSSAAKLGVAFSRFTRPTSDDVVDEVWQGYRTLSEEQVAQFARNIVIEIRNRGPFSSLADFINRRLVDNPDTDNAGGTVDAPFEHENFRGTIQAALDRTWDSVLDESDPSGLGAFPVNDGAGDFWTNWDDLIPEDQLTVSLTASQREYVYNEPMLWGGDEIRKPYSNLSAFAPKYVTQADVLSAIGANLTARSDTFTIRAYGEVDDGISSNGTSGVWCEAVVQRQSDYVDTSDAPELTPANLNPINRIFGRKFKIISFRWLSNDEV
ncbi:Unannotated [Lentimonas sp. CC19]|nr:Unannotated [Lentimonas sp. CC10]CAA6691959.1 Unannotated [Lentimonas sp. CC19]CAA7070561.1 Unannotated [Lentimonas sp. CC11]